jgi:predicted CXXCH cytochrome family protein
MRLRILALTAIATAAVTLVPTLKTPANTAEIRLGASCVTAECHGDTAGHEFIHGPLNLNQCEPCHIPIGGRHEFRAAATGPDLCRTCHDIEPDMKVVHGPFQADCTLCHNPHGGENRLFVKGGLGAESCNLCHDSVTEGRQHLHGPVAMGECLICHTPHQSENKGLLIEPRRDLCLGCHVDVEVQMANAVVVHEPVEEICSGCHDPHGGDHKYFIPIEGSDLCLNCHGEFIKNSSEFAHPHTSMTDGKGCRECHAPHASNQQGLLSTHTQQLCLACHSEEIHKDDISVNNVGAEIASASFLHGPIREQNCVACHKPHGSDVAAILAKPFPKDFYAPYKEGAYDFCFECHDGTIVRNERSTTTGFRDGDRNLHYLHVNREKGRTCRACHAEHASVQPNHVRSEVPFGRWMMQVKFEKNETGGTCETGCHVPYTYDRVTPERPAQ